MLIRNYLIYGQPKKGAGERVHVDDSPYLNVANNLCEDKISKYKSWRFWVEVSDYNPEAPLEP